MALKTLVFFPRNRFLNLAATILLFPFILLWVLITLPFRTAAITKQRTSRSEEYGYNPHRVYATCEIKTDGLILSATTDAFRHLTAAVDNMIASGFYEGNHYHLTDIFPDLDTPEEFFFSVKKCESESLMLEDGVWITGGIKGWQRFRNEINNLNSKREFHFPIGDPSRGRSFELVMRVDEALAD